MLAVWTGILAGLVAVLLILPVDWTPGRYKVIYHTGPTLGIKTKMLSGWLRIDDGQIKISGEQELALPLESLRSVERFRQFGLGSMIRIVHDQDTLFVSVVRFCIAGQFASIDFFKTRKLTKCLASSAKAVTN